MVTLNIKEIQRFLPLWEYVCNERTKLNNPESKATTNEELITVFEEVQALKEATGLTDILELLTTYAETWGIPIPPEVWPDEP